MAELIKGKNDLATANPELAKQWHPTKNGGLTPSDVSCGSNKKVWWICDKGHEWEAIIGSRNKGRGCPYCSNQKTLTGYNDLCTTHPEALSEWDYSKNDGIDPHSTQAGSEKKVWWICPRGHSYQMQIDRKVKYGHRCPICNKGRHTSFPEKAVAYYFQKIDESIIESFNDVNLKITEIDIYSPRKRFGIEYDGKKWHNEKTAKRDAEKNEQCKNAGITLYRIRENGCFPINNSKSVDIYYDSNDIASLEKIIKELIKKIYDIDYDVNIDRDKIEIYKKIDIWFENNSALNLGLEVISEWDYERNMGLEPSSFSANSHKKVWWKCSKCGGNWQASLANRSNNRGCPYCSGHKLLIGFNDLATVSPNLLSEWDYEKNDISPSNITAHSSEKVWWKCKKGHSYLARVSNRVDLNRGCPICSNKSIITGINDLATTNQALTLEWDYSKNDINPNEMSQNASVKVWWKCSKCGYEWKASPNSRVSKKTGCPKCADAKKGTNFKKGVCQISKDNTIIKTYDSVHDAALAVNRSPSAIVNACKGKVKTCAGYIWKYAKDQ